MLSHDLLVSIRWLMMIFILISFKLYFQSDLTLVRSWYLQGTHYSRTLEDWLKQQDKNRIGEFRADIKACVE